MLVTFLAIAVPLAVRAAATASPGLARRHRWSASSPARSSPPAALGKARTRTGANRARLMIAAGATLTFGAAIVLIGLGALPGADPVLGTVTRVLALVSGIGYLIAFLPPRWLRRVFSATAAQSVTERLLRAPVESPEQVWQTYAEIMRVQTGADAVAVLMPRADGQLAQAAYAGPPAAAPRRTRAPPTSPR